jgi:hypothetical protein
MNIRDAESVLPGMVAFDLQDFNDYRLDEAGELVIPKHFRKEVYLRLGSDLLQMSKMPMPAPENPGPTDFDPMNAYIVRNVSADRSDAAIIFDDSSTEKGHVMMPQLGVLTVVGRQSLVIGRDADATPELLLGRSTGRRHLSIRMSDRARSLHFTDLDSTNGSIVYLAPEDANGIDEPRRKFVGTFPHDVRTLEARNGRWTRY